MERWWFVAMERFCSCVRMWLVQTSEWRIGGNTPIYIANAAILVPLLSSSKLLWAEGNLSMHKIVLKPKVAMRQHMGKVFNYFLLRLTYLHITLTYFLKLCRQFKKEGCSCNSCTRTPLCNQSLCLLTKRCTIDFNEMEANISPG